MRPWAVFLILFVPFARSRPSFGLGSVFRFAPKLQADDCEIITGRLARFVTNSQSCCKIRYSYFQGLNPGADGGAIFQQAPT
jgi:hypothetical protein